MAGGTKRTLRVLVAEDSPDDCELLLLELARDYQLVSLRVDTREAMAIAVADQEWDLVLSDWSMPGFGALEALRLLREHNIDVPCIVASGTVGEDVAVEALRNGARDFLVKHQLARLLPAIRRELREAELRKERNRMEAQLMVSDRLASVGLLAAGVAHEINNPLAAVMSNVELAMRDLEAPDPLAHLDDVIEGLADAYAGAQRIRDIVRDLRIFSRSADESSVIVDVRHVLDSSLRMAHHEIRRRAELRREFVPVPLVRANESRLGQVFLNLIVNAAQSIPDGHPADHAITVRAYPGNNEVVVEVSDTGAGMSAAVLKQLFTPFFTTKRLGEGMGLGLSICHRIISDLGGTITVASTVGAGSTFCVRLPALVTVATEAAVAVGPVAPLRRSRILIVDDEPSIGRALARALRDSHEVVVLERAADALAAIVAGTRYDVILCDLMMPEMTGDQLHAALVDAAPEQAAVMIFVSGGAVTNSARSFLDAVPNPRLEKPFELATLHALLAARLVR